MTPAVAQSYQSGLGGSALGGILNKVGGKGAGGAAFKGNGGPPSSASSSQWDSYRMNDASPVKANGRDASFSTHGAGVAHYPASASSTPVPHSPLDYFQAISTSSSAYASPSLSAPKPAYTRAFPPPLEPRQYTVLREVGDGSFGTVWLADWHSPLHLPPGTLPPGPSSRAEYKGKQLVAVKRMKKSFEGGWDECMKLKELKSLRQIPMHPNIIPLYDAFLMPSTRELYFVFECMEGNLYQLTKSRKGRALAAGLTASIFYQILAGLAHVHASGYFHRDMKPENLLITTTGLADYPASSLYAHPNSVLDRDVVVVLKLADFGLARETNSRPPYTEYVSTRWYRAPEVLLRSRDYSIPVDMWALGTIMVEAITLKPVFPGDSEVDQIHKICQLLGDPSADYGVDKRGRTIGGGPWPRGAKMANDVGFEFPKMAPRSWTAFFDMNTVSIELIDCISDLLRYEPSARPSAQQCLNSAYFRDIAPRFAPRTEPQDRTVSLPASPISPRFPESSSGRDLPGAHNHGTPDQYKPPFQANGDSSTSGPYADRHLSLDSAYSVHLQRSDQYDSPMHAFPESVSDHSSAYPPSAAQQSWDGNHINWGLNPALLQPSESAMGMSQYRPIPAFGAHGRRESLGSIAPSIAASTFYDGSIFEGIAPSRAADIMSYPVQYSFDHSPPLPIFPDSPTMMDRDDSQDSTPAFVLGSGGSRTHAPPPQPQPQASTSAAKSGRSWGFFGGDKSTSSAAAPAPAVNPLKRTPSIASVHHSAEVDPTKPPLDPKKAKKEAEKAAREAERLKREMVAIAARERARAVMKKKERLQEAADPLHNFSNHARTAPPDKGKARASERPLNAIMGRSSRHPDMPQIVEDTSKLQVSGDSRYKMRRRDDDDDVHSVSSNETGHSSQRGRPFSISSQATSASEPSQRMPWPENDSQRIAPINSRHPQGYGSRAPSTGHSSLDLAARMQGLATSSSDHRADSRGHRSSSPASANERFSPYPFHSLGRGSGQSLPPISSFDGAPGHQRQSSQATQASVASYNSTPKVLPSHYSQHGDRSGPTLAPPFLLATTEATPPGASAPFPYLDPNQQHEQQR